MFGELLATSCKARGIVGLVLEAGVRDVTDITSMQFPVWAKAISAQGTVKANPGSVNVDIVCAGTLVCPGDVIIGDQDGVVVVGREIAAEVARLSMARIQSEQKSRTRLQAGELGVDFLGLRAKLKELGVEPLTNETENAQMKQSKISIITLLFLLTARMPSHRHSTTANANDTLISPEVRQTNA
jgi:4-hydroxy-4-methyl-2-oxoglutarate aldolase